MSTIAIGDIHGRINALNSLLEIVLPELQSGDELVFLGDIIDRGPSSKACVERLLHCRSETAASVRFVMGNHEQAMLTSCCEDNTAHTWLIAMEAMPTIADYAPAAPPIFEHEMHRFGRQLVQQRIPLPYRVFYDELPAEHVAFFQHMEVYVRTPDVLCVHASAPMDGTPIEKFLNPDLLMWGIKGFPRNYHAPERVVYGHWNNALLNRQGWPMPRMEGTTFGIDTIAHGVLTAIRFPDLRIFQSKRFEE